MGKEKRTMIIIVSKSGVSIREFSKYKLEEEVLFFAGTCFTVKAVNINISESLTVVHLEEMEDFRLIE
jgi:hypothetical protein